MLSNLHRLEGIITYTCWMGMIKSSITVVSDLSSVSIRILRMHQMKVSQSCGIPTDETMKRRSRATGRWILFGGGVHAVINI